MFQKNKVHYSENNLQIKQYPSNIIPLFSEHVNKSKTSAMDTAAVHI